MIDPENNDPCERLVELGIIDLLRQRSTPDLATVVRQAWERELRGAAPAEQHAQRSVPASPADHRRNGRSRTAARRHASEEPRDSKSKHVALALAAGFVGVLTVGVLTWRALNAGEGSESMVATGPSWTWSVIGSELMTRRDSEWSVATTPISAESVSAWTPVERVTLSPESGARMTLEPLARVDASNDAARVLWGECLVEAPLDQPLQVAAGAADDAPTFTLEPGARARVRTRRTDGAPRGVLSVPLFEQRRSPELLIELERLAGDIRSAELDVRETANVQQWTLTDAGARAFEGEEREIFFRLFDTVCMQSKSKLEASEGVAFSGWQLGNALRADPGLWLVIEAAGVQRYAGSKLDADAWNEFLYVVSRDGSVSAQRLAQKLFQIAPERFTSEHIVALATSGVTQFEREIELALDLEPLEVGPERPDLVDFAAWQTQRGETRWIGALERLTESIDSPTSEIQAYLQQGVPALALARAGIVAPWERYRTRGLDECEQLAEQGLGEPASMLFMTLEFMHDLRNRPTPLDLAFLERRSMEALWSDPDNAPIVERLGVEIQRLRER